MATSRTSTVVAAIACMLLVLGVHAASASQIKPQLAAEASAAAGRKLLAATDNRFDFYTKQYPNKNVMVCKRCDATNLQGATVAGTTDGGFKIFVIDSGIITRQGDGGTDNWQFRGCFTRGGNQGSIVTFTKC